MAKRCGKQAAAGGATVGQIVFSLNTADHDGWVLLDGRPVSELTASQQANAAIYGFTTNLPDGEGAVLRRASNETVGEVRGVNQTMLTQDNLPPFALTGQTESAGNHSHRFPQRDINATQARSGTSGRIARNGTVTRSTQAAGNHSHTVVVAAAFNNDPVNIRGRELVSNPFLYLGE